MFRPCVESTLLSDRQLLQAHGTAKLRARALAKDSGQGVRVRAKRSRNINNTRVQGFVLQLHNITHIL